MQLKSDTGKFPENMLYSVHALYTCALHLYNLPNSFT